MTGTWWSIEERDRLLEWAGDLPWSTVVALYQQWALKNGYPVRSDGAMRAICEEARASRIATGRWLNTGAVRGALGIGYPMLQRLMGNGLLEGRREGRRWYISRRSIRKLAETQPELFAGRPIADLLLLLDNQKLAETLAKRPPTWIHGRPRRVVCLETGEVFESLAAAGRRVHTSRSAVYLAVTGKRSHAGGYRFKYLDQEDTQCAA